MSGASVIEVSEPEGHANVAYQDDTYRTSLPVAPIGRVGMGQCFS